MARPAAGRFPFLDHPAPLAFAHRGGAGDWPENTWPAFRNAVELGYRYLETDVHVTADGVLVAFHDERLDRVTDRTGAIAERSWAEIAEARVDGREPVVLLEELLTAFPTHRFNLDPKADAVVEPLARLLVTLGALDRVCLGSFSDRRLARLRELLGPVLCTSAGPRGTTRMRAASYGAPVRPDDAGCLQVPVRARGVRLVDRRFVDAAHARGMQVHVWTVDDPAEMHELLDLGVDGIMTDRPAVLRAVLTERGAWAPHA
ncbi:MAG: glycerophosphodiester phosphodiesterase [Acidimicrobiales bacterium]|jgi:glycerophosphoryl diester phosphodiesterase|nr:glycerophosphodiester phosphodiesterase [Acidimicrobiales bacterium]